jgi:hypothetical protein
LAQTHIETDATTATARLPGLEIEIVHRRPAAGVEEISINLRALPSFAAFDRFLEMTSPMVFWARAAQMAWLPWLGVARMMVPGVLTPSPQIERPRAQDDDV